MLICFLLWEYEEVTQMDWDTVNVFWEWDDSKGNNNNLVDLDIC